MTGPQVENTLTHVLWDHGKQGPDNDWGSQGRLCGMGRIGPRS